MSAFDAGAIKGGINFDISEYTEGILQAQAVSAVFPQMVIEFLEAPLLAFIQMAKEGLHELVSAIDEVGQHFQSINLGSIKTGLDPETFATFSAAAKAAGLSAEEFGLGVENMGQRAAKALDGDKEAADGFAKLGISATRLAQLLKDPKEMLLSVSDGMRAIPTAGERANAAMEALGRQGREMIPFLQQGSNEIKDLAGKLGELEGQVGETQMEWGKAWSTMKEVFDAAWEGIASAIASPVLKEFSGHLNEIIATVMEFSASIRKGIGEAMSEIIPIAYSLWGVIEGVGGIVGGLLMPLLQALTPILELIAHLVRVIADTAGVALNGIAGVVRGAVGLFSGDMSGAESSFANASAAANRLPGDFGLSGGDGQTTNNINVTVDPKDSTGQISGKIQGAVRGAQADWDRKFNSDLSKHKVARGMGGRHA